MPRAKNESEQDDALHRRRGRPTGKNRVPLSLEERRARNAQYERERRVETADAMAQLAEALNCDPNISNADLLATTITQIQRYTENASDDNIEDLLRVNTNLENQIALLQERLGLDDASFEQASNEEFLPIATQSSHESSTANPNMEILSSRKQKKDRKRRLSSKHIFQEKRAKTRSETSADSGIDVQSISPSTGDISPDVSPDFRPDISPDVKPDFRPEISPDLRPDASPDITPGTSPDVSPEISPDINPMDFIIRSLFEIPPIKSPDVCTEEMKAGPSHMVYVEPMLPIPEEPICNHVLGNSDKNFCLSGAADISLDLLTDNEKKIIGDWLAEETQGSNNSTEQTPSSTCQYNTLGRCV